MKKEQLTHYYQTKKTSFDHSNKEKTLIELVKNF